MKIKLEIKAEDALNLCKFHHDFMEVAVSNIGSFPLEYSSASRITNDFFNEVVKKIPIEELERIKSKTNN